ncbi:lytic transglycosylase domain-containing protein [Actinoallomurus purpureus]|uniref:aggregation-promoting factor C-terminal-like domain-containing protein n=1 Tax=Actinoallomurus purpureus TaxID=478114 RepID=UPI002092EF3D|nr:lytic transglycosylase domain-containing protein [Actinoallomurus purpureus]MCO6006667.1 lytic transglycosylase domain-containing protein [Actinoallomurus purpureus]
MYGDRFGSPGRDDRQDGTEPHAPWDDARFLENQPSSEDVKVAGSPIASWPEGPDVSGATSAMPLPGTAETAPVDEFEVTRNDFGAPPPGGPLPPNGPGPGSGDDGFESMRRRSRPSGRLVKIGAIAAAAAVVVGGGTAAFALTGGDSTPTKKAAAEPSAQVQAQAEQPAPLTDTQRKSIESQRRKELKSRALRAARSEKDRPKLLAKGEPVPTKTPTTSPSSGTGGGGGDAVPAGEAQTIARNMLSSFGWSPSSQFSCLVSLWNRESGWRVHAANASGAYGIPQALPGSKMSSAGPDWQNDATTQIKWGLGYIKSRYSTPCGAWGHSQSTGWY